MSNSNCSTQFRFNQSCSTEARNYWKWLKGKLKQDGSEVVTVTHQLKLEAPDGKQRLTNVLDTQQVQPASMQGRRFRGEVQRCGRADVAKVGATVFMNRPGMFWRTATHALTAI